jgi:hypothetical protein
MMSTMIAVLMISAALVGFVPQLRKHAEFEERLEEIKTESAEQEQMLQDYRVRKERFRNDPNYVRKVAHEFGMVEPHEVIFRFYDDSRTASRR